jgi:hypothetical protein
MTNEGVEDGSIQALDYETTELGQNTRALDERPKISEEQCIRRAAQT